MELDWTGLKDEMPAVILSPQEFYEPPTIQEIKKKLEKGNEKEKISTMKDVLVMMSGGEPCSELLMPILRFIMPLKSSKKLKKLVL